MWLEFLIEGVKKFAGEIIGLILITMFFALFPGVRNLFNRYKPKKDDDITDIQDAIRELEAKRKEESERRAEAERLLELKRHEEALRAIEAQKAEEAKRRAEIERQLEAERQEKERIRAEEAQRRAEIQRQLETQRQEQERIQAEARKLEEALRKTEAKVAVKPEVKKQRPAMSDEEFIELCEFGDAREVEEAIKNGANVNAKDKYGNTALMIATRKGHTEVAELFLRHRADVNANNDNGITALRWATHYGHIETAELLRSYRAK